MIRCIYYREVGAVGQWLCCSLQRSQNKRAVAARLTRNNGQVSKHACSCGVASARVHSAVCGPGESRSEGSEVMRSRVPEGGCLHLWRLSLEEVLLRARNGWWGKNFQYTEIKFLFYSTWFVVNSDEDKVKFCLKNIFSVKWISRPQLMTISIILVHGYAQDTGYLVLHFSQKLWEMTYERP